MFGDKTLAKEKVKEYISKMSAEESEEVAAEATMMAEWMNAEFERICSYRVLNIEINTAIKQGAMPTPDLMLKAFLRAFALCRIVESRIDNPAAGAPIYDGLGDPPLDAEQVKKVAKQVCVKCGKPFFPDHNDDGSCKNPEPQDPNAPPTGYLLN